jgi:hypothetical protein
MPFVLVNTVDGEDSIARFAYPRVEFTKVEPDQVKEAIINGEFPSQV